MPPRSTWTSPPVALHCRLHASLWHVFLENSFFSDNAIPAWLNAAKNVQVHFEGPVECKQAVPNRPQKANGSFRSFHQWHPRGLRCDCLCNSCWDYEEGWWHPVSFAISKRLSSTNWIAFCCPSESQFKHSWLFTCLIKNIANLVSFSNFSEKRHQAPHHKVRSICVLQMHPIPNKHSSHYCLCIEWNYSRLHRFTVKEMCLAMVALWISLT